MSKRTLVPLAALLSFGLPARAGERIPWPHPSLELHRSAVHRDGNHLSMEFCVEPKEGVPEGITSIGYPKYQTPWGRWLDCPIAGLDMHRPLHVSAQDGPACFSVLVAADATAVELRLGPRLLEIPVGPLPDSTASMDVVHALGTSLSARPNGLAVVLGVERYAKIPEASFAAADATTAALYFEKVLGIPSTRIARVLDGEATLGEMQRIFGPDGWLARRVVPDSEIFVFFAGHGTAELETFSPYLLPADGDPEYLRQTALSLDRLIEMVASLSARRTTLFLDACFSGLTREGSALVEDSRPLVVERVPRAPAGLSIFSAGSRGQRVSALEAEGHGVFSYLLFKGVAGAADLDHDRRVLASELKAYLEDAVPRAALSLDREQSPGIVLADPDEVLVQLP